jgi:hypothetical protein
LQSVKNNRYPDLKVAGQYQRLTNASIDLKSIKIIPPEPVPIVNQLMLGQVNASLPIFAGFKIQTIKAYDNMYQAEAASAMQTKKRGGDDR